MNDRISRKNEVCSLSSADGRTVFAIVQRSDGLFGVHQDCLSYDDEEDVEYWIPIDGPTDGLYGTAEEAVREIKTRHSIMF